MGINVVALSNGKEVFNGTMTCLPNEGECIHIENKLYKVIFIHHYIKEGNHTVKLFLQSYNVLDKRRKTQNEII